MGSKYLYHFTVIILSIVIFLCFIYPVNKKHLPFDVNDIIEGKYKKPYVYRTLIPTTIKIISLVIPEKIHNSVSDFVNLNKKLSDTFENLRWDKRFALKYFISSFFMFVFFAAFGYLIPKFVFLFAEISYTYKNKIIISGLSLFLLPGFFLYGSHIYDPPQLFLFTLALYILYKQKFLLFYFLFVLITVNKETSLLLILIFFFYYFRKISDKKFVYLIILYTITFLIIKLLITYIFRENEGPFMEYHLFEHNLRIRYSVIAFAMNSGFFILLLFLSVLNWNIKPEYIKTSFIVIIIPTFILTLFWGYVDELRVYYELYPVMITAVSLTLQHIITKKS